MTNFIIVIAAVVFGVIVEMDFDIRALPLALVLTVLGTYGALACAKLYERWQLHVRRARYWLRRIDELCPNAQVIDLQEIAESEHYARYGRLTRLRLHRLWVALHIFIALSGLACSVVIVVFYWR
jgi:hypothetical protein